MSSEKTTSDLAFDADIDLYVKAALGRKTIGLTVLDIRELSSVADILIVGSGRSNRQVTAIGEFIRTELKAHNIRPLGIEGLKEGHWVLMDYGHVVIHIFYESVRAFYDIEGLWADAKKVQTESMRHQAQNHV